MFRRRPSARAFRPGPSSPALPFVMLLGATFVACSSDPSTPSGAGGQGGAGGRGGASSAISTSTGGSTSSATSSAGGEGGAGGAGGAGGGEPVEPGCDAPAEAPSGGACVPEFHPCNPVTNEGCDEPGASCDDDGQGGFICFSPPNEQPLCAACGGDAGECAPGTTCVAGSCARYCCEDADCGTGTCDKTTYVEALGAVGVCAGS